MERLSRKAQATAELFGGADTAPYDQPDEAPSCDKGNHKERSIAIQPNHRIHWKKLENIVRSQEVIVYDFYNGKGITSGTTQ